MSDQTLSLISDALATVSDPELHRPLPDLGMVEEVHFVDGTAKLKILLTISGCPMRDRLQKDINEAVLKVPQVSSVEIEFGVMNETQRDNVKKLLRGGREKFIPFAQPDSLTRVWGISSGKGGVGKSSVTVNLAAALSERGFKVEYSTQMFMGIPFRDFLESRANDQLLLIRHSFRLKYAESKWSR